MQPLNWLKTCKGNLVSVHKIAAEEGELTDDFVFRRLSLPPQNRLLQGRSLCTWGDGDSALSVADLKESHRLLVFLVILVGLETPEVEPLQVLLFFESLPSIW